MQMLAALFHIHSMALSRARVHRQAGAQTLAHAHAFMHRAEPRLERAKTSMLQMTEASDEEGVNSFTAEREKSDQIKKPFALFLL